MERVLAKELAHLFLCACFWFEESHNESEKGDNISAELARIMNSLYGHAYRKASGIE